MNRREECDLGTEFYRTQGSNWQSLFQTTHLEACITVGDHASYTFVFFFYIFNDLFIILISEYITQQFRYLNSQLLPRLTTVTTLTTL